MLCLLFAVDFKSSDNTSFCMQGILRDGVSRSPRNVTAVYLSLKNLSVIVSTANGCHTRTLHPFLGIASCIHPAQISTPMPPFTCSCCLHGTLPPSHFAGHLPGQMAPSGWRPAQPACEPGWQHQRGRQGKHCWRGMPRTYTLACESVSVYLCECVNMCKHV